MRQMELMRVLWDLGEATARDITDELNRRAAEGTPPMAHSTVQTQLRELEGKGVVAHRQEERTFVFYPTVAQGEVTTGATRDLLSRLFEGSPLRLMSHLLQHENLTHEDLSRLRRLIDEKAQEGDKGDT
jgi:BlaI family penicillinase repressor